MMLSASARFHHVQGQWTDGERRGRPAELVAQGFGKNEFTETPESSRRGRLRTAVIVRLDVPDVPNRFIDDSDVEASCRLDEAAESVESLAALRDRVTSVRDIVAHFRRPDSHGTRSGFRDQVGNAS
jgi:hypothetical protein